ncbi:hypothetical protein KIL84_011336 [Mauremys mutica]|uniref:Uncharacterized protein n=1 Tax=Mauremys mutica TaxID=74926 RepID=A0A9D3XBV0_9SAUR|nr:hypothetical protein KIL84_011336 [Mauremys mutica]
MAIRQWSANKGFWLGKGLFVSIVHSKHITKIGQRGTGLALGRSGFRSQLRHIHLSQGICLSEAQFLICTMGIFCLVYGARELGGGAVSRCGAVQHPAQSQLEPLGATKTQRCSPHCKQQASHSATKTNQPKVVFSQLSTLTSRRLKPKVPSWVPIPSQEQPAPKVRAHMELKGCWEVGEMCHETPRLQSLRL